MNKVVCNICGTSYPENVTECPICGFSRSSDHSRENSEHTYTHVPGGRFSKNNVRKRNQSVAKKTTKPVPERKPNKAKEEKTNIGLVIVIVLLLLAIITVAAYIVLRFFVPNFTGFDSLGKPAISQNDEVSTDETPVATEDIQPDDEIVTEAEPVLCQEINLDQSQINCETLDSTYQLTYQITPDDTEEEVLFFTSDADVATVDEFGLITVCGEGTAIITVSCGSASAQCEVICTLSSDEPVTIALNRKEITFSAEGESWMLYDGPVNAEDILWTSDDNKVATIKDGKVIAIGDGDTTVYGFYEGQTVTCIIHCKFDDADEEDGNVSEADGDTEEGGTYELFNLFGRSDDVTINVGEEFPLKLIDQDKKTVEGAEWSVENPNVCSYQNGTVKALASGTTKIIATYKGKTYTCTVRVL